MKGIMKRRQYLRLCIIFLIASLLIPFITDAAAVNPDDTVEEIQVIHKKNTYDSYLSEHGNVIRPSFEVAIQVDQYADADESVEAIQGFEGVNEYVVSTSEEGFIEWDVEMPESGFYNLFIEYFPVKGKSAEIEREVSINGKVPFSGAGHIMLSRVWANADKITRDNRDNDLRPRQIEKPEWQSCYFTDYMGYIDEPYLFYFKTGINRLRLTSVKEPMVIKKLILKQAEGIPTYNEVLEMYEEKGYKQSTGYMDTIQGEDAGYKSDPTLYPVYDRTSPATEPYDKSKIRLNTIGGFRWSLPGQWIAWDIEVPDDGLYQITIKGRQNIVRGLYSNRKITINGKVPFKEMENVEFKYNNKWQMYTLGGSDPYLFYLEKGKNRIKMEIVLGDLAEILRIAEDTVYTLNTAYRKIIMITGSVPDQYRDYQLEKKLPDVMAELRKQSQILDELSLKLQNYTGQKGSHNAILDRLSYQLNNMAEKPRTIQNRLDDFKANVGSLGTWILDTREQPLEIDYIKVHSPDKLMELPKPDVGLLDRAVHEFLALIASYTEDYDSVGNVYNESESVSVWIGTGRDQAQILKEMIDDTFTPITGIPVNLELVQQGVLLPATIAGRGPDVAMSVGNGEPVNYASRNAVIDISEFSDYDEVINRFKPSATVPFQFEGGVYGLPETQTFPMLFYRQDILEELGLAVPETWDDIFNILPDIQKNNMEFSIPVSDTTQPWLGMISYATLLYQAGGDLYYEDGVASALDAETAIDVFQKWTDLYVSYRLPLQVDVANRFRTGEIPIAIYDYSLYNYLQVFAPELRGLWDFAPIPGMVQADGEINRSAPSSGSAVMMLKNAKDAKDAWAFMKWWTDTDTQVRFGREMESLMGAAGRHPTANVDALQQLPWPVKDYQALNSQREWVKGNPEVPGGYFTYRHLDNAFRAVVYRGDDPRETILDYVRIINEEIDNKRKEFGLPLREKR